MEVIAGLLLLVLSGLALSARRGTGQGGAVETSATQTALSLLGGDADRDGLTNSGSAPTPPPTGTSAPAGLLVPPQIVSNITTVYR